MAHLTIIVFALTTILVPVLAAYNFGNYPVCAQSYLYANAPASCDYGSVGSLEVSNTNHCLCTDYSFLQNSAAAIYANCGCSDLETSANTQSDNCASSGTNSVLTPEEFVSTGDGGQSVCGEAVQSPVPSSTPVTASSATTFIDTTSTTPITAPNILSVASQTPQDTTFSTSTTQSSTSPISSTSPSGSSSSSQTSGSNSSETGTGLQVESNRIALGVGISFGVVTAIGVVVTIWMCCRRRR